MSILEVSMLLRIGKGNEHFTYFLIWKFIVYRFSVKGFDAQRYGIVR